MRRLILVTTMTNPVETTTKPHVYRVGDMVKIVEPQVVFRVGYPLTLEDGMKAAEEKWSAKVNEFMKEIDGGTEALRDIFDYDARLYNDLVHALGSYHLRVVKFGGRQRSIHAETHEELRNTAGWKVIKKRHVKTGTWSPGYQSYDGDYDPPYLANEQTHTLLSLEVTDEVKGTIWTRYSLVEVDAVNVCPHESEEGNARTGRGD